MARWLKSCRDYAVTFATIRVRTPNLEPFADLETTSWAIVDEVVVREES